MKSLIPIEKQFKIWASAALLFIILTGVMVNFLAKSYKNQIGTLMQNDLESFAANTNTVLKTYENFSNYIFTEIVDTTNVKLLINAANTTSEPNKSDLRNRLYNLLAENYQEMLKFNFRQLSFTLLDGETFLRFQNGGVLMGEEQITPAGIRESNSKSHLYNGFSGVKMNNSYNVVYPLILQENQIGAVEISITLSTVVDILGELNPYMETYLVIEDDVVHEMTPSLTHDEYEPSFISDEYMFDKEVNTHSREKNILLSMEDRIRLFHAAHSRYLPRLSDNESFAIVQLFDGSFYLIRFLVVNNITNIPTAYLVAVTRAQHYEVFYLDAIISIVLTILIMMTFLVTTFLFTRYHVKLRKIAGTDYLTQANNRQRFMQIAIVEMARCQRYNKLFSILMFDIDWFKKINDRYGHAAGDRILQRLSEVISANIRVNDTFARWGGEEFVLLLPESDMEASYRTAEKLRKLISTVNFQLSEPVTVSVGVATWAGGDQSIDTAIDLADQALYQAKNCGRNRVIRFDHLPGISSPV